MRNHITTEQAFLEGAAPDLILGMFANQKLANAIMDVRQSFSRRWFLVKTERDIQDMQAYYKSVARLLEGCVGGMLADNALESIAKRRDKKLADLGCYYK